MRFRPGGQPTAGPAVFRQRIGAPRSAWQASRRGEGRPRPSSTAPSSPDRSTRRTTGISLRHLRPSAASGVITTSELAEWASISRSRLYELLAEAEERLARRGANALLTNATERPGIRRHQRRFRNTRFAWKHATTRHGVVSA